MTILQIQQLPDPNAGIDFLQVMLVLISVTYIIMRPVHSASNIYNNTFNYKVFLKTFAMAFGELLVFYALIAIFRYGAVLVLSPM